MTGTPEVSRESFQQILTEKFTKRRFLGIFPHKRSMGLVVMIRLTNVEIWGIPAYELNYNVSFRVHGCLKSGPGTFLRRELGPYLDA